MPTENLLELLSIKGNTTVDPWASLAATQPQHARTQAADKDAKLNELLERINGLKSGAAEPQPAEEPRDATLADSPATDGSFFPLNLRKAKSSRSS
jgi:hypothetical protein